MISLRFEDRAPDSARKKDGRSVLSRALKRDNDSPSATLETRVCERAEKDERDAFSPVFFSFLLSTSDAVHFGCVKQRLQVVCDSG